MAFTTGTSNDPGKTGAGERRGEGLDLTIASFENGLKVGRFCKLDTGRIDNLDGSSLPVVAGVVLRNIAGDVESAGTVSSALFTSVTIRRAGLVTVRVKTGDSPTRFTRVYVSNLGDANDGLATTSTAGVPISGEFEEDLGNNVWLIHLTPNWDQWTVGLIPALWSAMTVADWADAKDVEAGVKSLSLQLRDLDGAAVAELAVLRLTCEEGATMTVATGTALGGSGTNDIIAQTDATGLLTVLVSCATSATITVVAGVTQASSMIDCRATGQVVFE